MSEEPHIVGKIEFENTTTDERLKDSMAQEIGELLRAKKELLGAAKAFQELNACYRLGKQPSEALFNRLEKGRKAIEKYK